MCPRTTIHVSYYYMCPHTTMCVLVLLYMCPHSPVYDYIHDEIAQAPEPLPAAALPNSTTSTSSAAVTGGSALVVRQEQLSAGRGVVSVCGLKLLGYEAFSCLYTRP